LGIETWDTPSIGQRASINGTSAIIGIAKFENRKTSDPSFYPKSTSKNILSADNTA
jgi:hypothetical protein